MIDTIVLFVPNNNSKPFDYNKIAKPYSFIPHNTSELLTSGHFENFSIKQKSSGLFISGSIAKYIYNQNLFIPSLNEIEKALNDIASSLNFNLNDALVYRIDIGYNFHLKHEVKKYLGSFGELGVFNKSINNDLETLTYSTQDNAKQIQFYHKLLEMKHDKKTIPDEYKKLSKHILRYELKLRKNLKDELGYDIITANMIYEKHFFKLLVERWYYYYKAIHKINKTRLRSYVLKNQSQMKNALAAHGLNSIGYDSIMNFVDTHKKDYEKTTIARIKKMINELSKNTDATVTYQLINELDDVIKNVYTNCISNFTWPSQP